MAGGGVFGILATMKPLSTNEDVQDIINASHAHPQIIFKHSHVCAMSSHALAELEIFDEASNIDIHILIIQETGDLKLHIAELFHIPHESPQVIALNNGEVSVVFNHWDITASALAQ